MNSGDWRKVLALVFGFLLRWKRNKKDKDCCERIEVEDYHHEKRELPRSEKGSLEDYR